MMSFETTTQFFLGCKSSQKSEKCVKNIRKMACFVVKEAKKSDKISGKKCFFLIFSNPNKQHPKKEHASPKYNAQKLKIVWFSPIFLKAVEKHVN